MDKKRKFILIFIGTLLLLGLLFLSSHQTLLSSRSPERYLFAEVAGLKLQREFTGDEAFEMVRGSHFGKLKAAHSAAIGYYQEGLTIWLAEYESGKVASKETKRMVKAIEAFSKGFESPKRLGSQGNAVYRTRYRGAFHYFWTKKNFIFYIVPGPLSDSEAKMLIEDINSCL